MFTDCQRILQKFHFKCLQRVNIWHSRGESMRYILKNRLAECRDAKGVKKSQLAYYLRMSRGYVTRLERGDIRPSAEAMLRIARYFGRPAEEVFQLVEETSGKAAFQPISRRASVRAGESTITAGD